MAGKKQKKTSGVTENWEAEIAAYDEDCRFRDAEYKRHAITVSKSGNSELTEEESEVITLYLNGVSCIEIARQFEVEVELITGLLDIMRAKLSLIEKYNQPQIYTDTTVN